MSLLALPLEIRFKIWEYVYSEKVYHILYPTEQYFSPYFKTCDQLLALNHSRSEPRPRRRRKNAIRPLRLKCRMCNPASCQRFEGFEILLPTLCKALRPEIDIALYSYSTFRFWREVAVHYFLRQRTKRQLRSIKNIAMTIYGDAGNNGMYLGATRGGYEPFPPKIPEGLGPLSRLDIVLALNRFEEGKLFLPTVGQIPQHDIEGVFRDFVKELWCPKSKKITVTSRRGRGSSYPEFGMLTVTYDNNFKERESKYHSQSDCESTHPRLLADWDSTDWMDSPYSSRLKFKKAKGLYGFKDR